MYLACRLEVGPAFLARFLGVYVALQGISITYIGPCVLVEKDVNHWIVNRICQLFSSKQLQKFVNTLLFLYIMKFSSYERNAI